MNRYPQCRFYLYEPHLERDAYETVCIFTNFV